jgi:hypothetical protein
VGDGSVCVGSDPVVVVISTVTSGTVTGTLGMTGTDVTGFTGLAGFSGLTGDVGFVGLLRDFTHESAVVVHPVHIGAPYGSGHVDVRICVVDPTYPAAQLSVWLSTFGTHVCGSATHVLWVNVHSLHTGWL